MTTIFQDIFDVRNLNENGKKFERVDRLHCKGTTYDVDLVLDINCELFNVRAGDRVVVAYASSLSFDGSPDNSTYNPNPGASLLDAYDYVMHGRVFLIKHIENQRVEVQASFGGLLMRLRGEQSQVEAFAVDDTFYILLRKGGEDLSSMDI